MLSAELVCELHKESVTGTAEPALERRKLRVGAAVTYICDGAWCGFVGNQRVHANPLIPLGRDRLAIQEKWRAILIEKCGAPLVRILQDGAKEQVTDRKSVV